MVNKSEFWQGIVFEGKGWVVGLIDFSSLCDGRWFNDKFTYGDNRGLFVVRYQSDYDKYRPCEEHAETHFLSPEVHKEFGLDAEKADATECTCLQEAREKFQDVEKFYSPVAEVEELPGRYDLEDAFKQLSSLADQYCGLVLKLNPTGIGDSLIGVDE